MEEKIKLNNGASWSTFKNARLLRENMTECEKLLWDHILSKKKMLGFKFRKQHPFNIYILDFYCHELKLSIEVDGCIHDENSQKEYDKIRTQYLASAGIKEFRIKNKEILKEINEVKLKIEAVIYEIKNGYSKELT